MKKALTTVIGIGAFVIGGLMARESALEGIDLLENKINDFKEKHRHEEMPPE